MSAAEFSRFQWSPNNGRIRTTITGRYSVLMGTGACGDEALRAEFRGALSQVYDVSLHTLRQKLDIVKPSKQIVFDAAHIVATDDARSVSFGFVILFCCQLCF